MWIKSWDGNCIVNTDRIVDIRVDMVSDISFAISVYGDYANGHKNTAIIGGYKTQSRAIEVLEMIYNHLEQGHRTFSLPEE